MVDELEAEPPNKSFDGSSVVSIQDFDICLKLNEAETNALTTVLEQYKDVFATNPKSPSPAKGVVITHHRYWVGENSLHNTKRVVRI